MQRHRVYGKKPSWGAAAPKTPTSTGPLLAVDLFSVESCIFCYLFRFMRGRFSGSLDRVEWSSFVVSAKCLER